MVRTRDVPCGDQPSDLVRVPLRSPEGRSRVSCQQAAFIELLRQTAQKAGIVLPLQIERPGLKAKANRILELEPYFQQGHLYVAKSPAMAEFLDQYQRFPRTVRVDVLDALAYGPRFWKREQVGAVNIEERRAKELEAYRARRYGG